MASLRAKVARRRPVNCPGLSFESYRKGARSIHAQQAAPKTRRRLAVAALSVLLILALLYLFRARLQAFDWSAFAGTFYGVRWAWVIGSVPWILLAYAGRALRWQVMLQKPDPSFWKIFIATAIGFTAIVFFGRAGEFVRPYLIAKKEGLPFSSQLAAWLLERILDLMMVLLIFGLALAQISKSGVEVGPRLKLVLQAGGSIITAVGAGCVIFLILSRYLAEPMQKRLMGALGFLPEHMRNRLERFLSTFLGVLTSTRSNSFVIKLILYSVLEWLLIISCYFCLLKGFPATQNFTVTDVVIFMGFISFGAAIQIPGVGGGVQVASILVFTEFFQIPLEVSTGLALVMWLITFVVIVPIGVAFALHEGLKFRNLSHIGEVEP